MILVKPSKDILQLNKGFNFRRDSTAFDDQGNLYLPHNARFQDGKFGKALFVEEGTKNLWQKSKDITSWRDRAIGVESIAKSTECFRLLPAYTITLKNNITGSKFVRIDAPYVGIPVTDYDPNSVTFHVREINHRYVGFRVRSRNSVHACLDLDTGNVQANNPDYSIQATSLEKGWYRVVVTNNNFTDGDYTYYGVCIPSDIRGIESGECNGEQVQIAGALQLEKAVYATSYTGGTRSSEIATVPINTLTPEQGQIDHYAHINDMARRQVEGQTPTLLHIPRQDGGMGIRVCHAEDTAEWVLQTQDNANVITEVEAPDTLTPDGWHRFTVKWTATEAKLLIDGVTAGIIAAPALPSAFANEAFIGSYDGQKDFLNTLHDDIRVSSISRADEDDLADFTADQPLPTDQYTIHKQSFDAPNDVYVRQGLVL